MKQLNTINKKIIQLSCLGVIGLSLAACQPLQTMQQQVKTVFVTEPQEECDSSKVEQFNRIQWSLNKVKLGMGATEVQSYLGIPAKWESFILTDGREVQVMFYRTNYRSCGLAQSAWGEFLPMVFSNNRLSGYGNNYYDGMIRPAITQSAKEWHIQQKYNQPDPIVKQFPYGEQSYK